MTETIYSDARRAIDGLLNAERAGLNPVRLMVVGGSSSEMAGGVIGLTVGCLCAAAGRADREIDRSH